VLGHRKQSLADRPVDDSLPPPNIPRRIDGNTFWV
jgi:hypothetical protein